MSPRPCFSRLMLCFLVSSSTFFVYSPEFKSSELASLFLFGVAFLLADENDVGVEVGARVLLAGPGLYLGLFVGLFLILPDMPDVPDVPAVLLASSHGCSKSNP